MNVMDRIAQQQSVQESRISVVQLMTGLAASQIQFIMNHQAKCSSSAWPPQTAVICKRLGKHRPPVMAQDRVAQGPLFR